MTRRHPRMCLLGVWMTTHNIPQNPQKKAWLGIFQPNWQKYKIFISPAAKMGSTANFDTVIEPHSWLRGWSRITYSYSRWRTAAILQNVGYAITRLSMDRLGWNLGGRIPSCPQYVPHIHQYGDWYTGCWWVGCDIWYNEEGSGRAVAPPRPLLGVPTITAHPSTASVTTSYYSMWHYCLCT